MTVKWHFEGTEYEEFRHLCSEIETFTADIVTAGRFAAEQISEGETISVVVVETNLKRVRELEDKLNLFASWYPQFAQRL